MPSDFKTLISLAEKNAGKREITRDVNVGRVACALETKSGKTYTGFNVNTSAHIGFWAEIMAIAQALHDGETAISVLVGVNDEGQIIPPCGRCREMLFQINRGNLATQIVLSETTSVTLEELLPMRWQEFWAGRE